VDLPIIASTFLLTLLMMVGLFFFIRASVKDRTKQIQLVVPPDSEDVLLKKLQQYFEERAYQLTAIDSETKQVTFKGFVRPSWFLAILLTILAAVGLSCLALILLLLFPNTSNFLWLLLLIAPVAGVFYWRKSGRWEKILLQVISKTGSPNLVSVTAHRDELIQLQENLSLQVVE
jgi:Cofactor assembly of complex C subunit B